MLTFRPLSLTDKAKINEAASAENSRSADYCFGNMFLWDRSYQQLLADSGRRLVTLCRSHEHPEFLFPIGSGDLAPVIDEMRQYAMLNGFPLVIHGLEERHAASLDCLFPGRFLFTEDREYADYIYRADKLISLNGRHLHGKRNHCNRFEAEHDWSFRALTKSDFPACMALLERWAAEEAPGSEPSVTGEHAAILRALEYFEALDLLGGALYAEGELVAFAIGEAISSETFDVHFEKARADINGAYPMINREFVRLICGTYPSVCYVNREDDMGLENLRKSKESYCPDILLRKFTARWREEA